MSKKENKIIATFNNFKESSQKILDGVQKSGDVYNEIVNSATKLAETRRDFEIIKAKKEIELSRINKSHEQNMKIIDNEYTKQDKSIDIAGNVVAQGLEKENLDMIAMGLHSITSIANHNPFDHYQRSLDNDLKKLSSELEDDDIIIEI